MKDQFLHNVHKLHKKMIPRKVGFGHPRNFKTLKEMSLGTDHLTCRGGYGFLFCSEIFFRTTQFEYLFFLLRKAQNYFSRI